MAPPSAEPCHFRDRRPGLWGGGLDWLEHRLMDSRFACIKTSASNTVVHVGIDSRSIRELDKWPWPRRHHANLIRQLDAAKAARIVLDIDFSSPSTPEADADLAAAIEAASGRVVLPMFKQRATNNTGALVYTEPLEMFANFAQIALITMYAPTRTVWSGATIGSRLGRVLLCRVWRCS